VTEQGIDKNLRRYTILILYESPT